jgi:hypothetical protein
MKHTRIISDEKNSVIMNKCFKADDIINSIQRRINMKRVITAIAIISVAAAVPLQCKKEKKLDREGYINAFVGMVQIAAGSDKSPASVGKAIKEGMVIETSEKSYADIYFGDSSVRVLEKSRVAVKSLQPAGASKGESSHFFIEKGKLFTKIGRKLTNSEEYRVSTGTTTAAVRGTQFLVEDKEGKSLVACLNGRVRVSNDASPDMGQVDVLDEQEVVVEKDKKLDVKGLSEDNRKNMENIIKNFQEVRVDIRKKFEEQREEIRKAVEDQKAQNREMMDKQKAEDQERVKGQIDSDKANVEALKGGKSDEIKDDSKNQVQEQKAGPKSEIDNLKKLNKNF